MESADFNVHERLNALIKRRNVNLDDVKFRGRLRTVKWQKFEAAQKQHLLNNFNNNLNG